MSSSDVVIVGGGLVGCSLAAALASSPHTAGLRVTLIDPSPPPPPSPSSSVIASMPSLRTSTISPSSHLFLQSVGIWAHLPRSKIADVHDMYIYDHPHPSLINNFTTSTTSTTTSSYSVPHVSSRPTGALHFDAAAVDASVMAHVVDNASLRTAAYTCLREHAQRDNSPIDLDLLTASVTSIDFPDTTSPSFSSPSSSSSSIAWPRLHLSTNQTVQARLLVIADGGQSRTRMLCEADWVEDSYDEMAVVANVRVDHTFHTAFQRFLSTGPLAVLPVAGGDETDHFANVIWSTTPGEARALLRADDAEFVNELADALVGDDGDVDMGDGLVTMVERLVNGFAHGGSKPVSTTRGIVPRLPRPLKVVGRRASFPLKRGHAARYVLADRRAVLIGDAGHVIHPLAGQGVNLGFADAESLGRWIVQGVRQGRDIGGENGAVVNGFESERMSRNVAMMMTVGGVKEMFAAGGVARVARRVGVRMIEAWPAVKKGIVRAMR